MMQQRQCVILEGDAQWCRTASNTLLENFDNSTVISLSSNENEPFLSISQKQAKQYLGKEFDAVIFDALTDFNPDSLGAIIGTIKQGGVLILWLETQQASFWLERFKGIVKQFEERYSSFSIVQQGQILPQLHVPELRRESNEIYLTEDQKKAVEAIKHVVHGHRRRPLVLSADRGRGKSASLGIAAAQLLREGKQAILLTAPSLAIAETAFNHASQLLPEAEQAPAVISMNGAVIRFVAPDALIESDFKADLLLIDEAAAIPASMLEKLLQKYSRIVFSTTRHGYEGTGRGFAIRFQKTLDEKTPNWRSYQMTTPIRWADDDLLEVFCFQSLLLNALPVADDLINEAQLDDCQIEQLDARQLIEDEQSLKELFGLMVLAHYRTRPSDLKMLLDRDDITLVVARFQGHIIASAWIVDEGELEDNLSQAVYEGRRRLKGHLLPQSLLAHAGMKQAGALRYQRIVRIAVHPAVQRRNIGHALLEQCVNNAQKQGIDVIGSSFSMSDNLIEFWSKSAFTFVRLGIQADAVSANHSAMMLQPLSERGAILVNESQQRFQQQWRNLLLTDFKVLSAEVVIKISQHIPAPENDLSQWQHDEIKAFCTAQRAYDFSHISLARGLSNSIHQAKFQQLSIQQQHTCVMSLLQHRSWSEIAQHLSFTGKAEVMATLREAMAKALLMH